MTQPAPWHTITAGNTGSAGDLNQLLGVHPGYYGYQGIPMASNNLNLPLNTFTWGFETTASPWNTDTNITVALTTTQAFTGTHSLQMSSVAAGAMKTEPLSGTDGRTLAPALPGQLWTASAYIRSAVSARSTGLNLLFYNADGTVNGTVAGGTTTDSTSVWTAISVSGLAPANAFYVTVQAFVNATGGASEVHYLDFVTLFGPPTPGVETISNTPVTGYLNSNTGVAAQWIDQIFNIGGSTTLNDPILAGALSINFNTAPAGFLNGEPVTVDVTGQNPEVTNIINGVGTLSWNIFPPLSFAHGASVTITAQNRRSISRVALFAGPGNMLTADQASFETGTAGSGGSIAGWVPNTNCSVAQTAAQHLDGTHALSITSTAGGAMRASSEGNIGGASLLSPVIAGNTYTGQINSRAAVTGQNFRADINWFTSARVFISQSLGVYGGPDTTSGWTAATVTAGLAPATAAYASVSADYQTTGGAAEVHYIDNCAIFPATQTTGWALPKGGTGADVTVSIQPDAFGVPSGTSLASTVLPADFQGALNPIPVPLPCVSLSPGLNYHIVISGTADTVNFAQFAATASVAGQVAQTSSTGTSGWVASSSTLVFGVFSGPYGVLRTTYESNGARWTGLQYNGAPATGDSYGLGGGGGFGPSQILDYNGVVRQSRSITYVNGIPITIA